MKKILILGLIVCLLFVVSIDSTTAIDEQRTVTDPENDVMNLFTEGYTSKKPNIDITEITYAKEGEKVTLTLKVKGKIEKRGNFEDLENSDSISKLNMVCYALSLTTSDKSYSILYINDVCNVYYGDIVFDTSDFSVDDNMLTVFFDLVNANETCQSLGAYSQDYKLLLFRFYFDEVSEESLPLEIDSGGPYTGSVGESINFSGTAKGGSFPYKWKWDLDGDDSVDSTKQTPTYTYATAGEYTVTFTVTDNEGSTKIDTTTVTISADGNNDDGDGGADDDTDGTSGDSDKNNSSDSGLTFFVALIAIICIVGIIILIIVIRR